MVLVVKNLPVSAGDARDAGLIPGLGRSPGGGNGSPLQYPCLKNPTDREAWQATAYKVTKSTTLHLSMSMMSSLGVNTKNVTLLFLIISHI